MCDMQKNTITLATGIITKIKNNRIEVIMPSIENRSSTFVKLMRLCNIK